MRKVGIFEKINELDSMKDFLLFSLGASLGSFFGLLISRFPECSIIFPGSHCDHCHNRLHLRDLIPILSLFINGFRCRFCQRKISAWYSLIEFACGLILVLVGKEILPVSTLILLYTGLVLSLYDLKTQTYPLSIWLVFFCLGLFFSTPSLSTLICIILAVLAQCQFFKIGAGDFLYLASASLVFNFYTLILMLQISCLLALAYFIVRRIKVSIPFIPFLSIASLLLIIFQV